MRFPFFSLRRIGAGVLAAAALLVAQMPAARAATEVRVGFIPVAGIGQLFVIDGEGWAREAGIELKLTQFESGPAMISALASGTLDAYYGGIGPILVSSARGIPVKAVAATAIEELALVGRGDIARLQNAASAEGFKAFVAAQGRPVKIATQPPGSVPDTVLRYWLQKVAKVDPKHYQIVPMGIEQTQQALLAGAVDVATVREPALTVVLDRDPGTKLLVRGGTMQTDQPGSVLALHGAFRERSPEAAVALLKLHVRATELLRKEPKRAAVHLHKGLGKGLTDLATFERALVSPASNYVSDPSRIKVPTGVMQDFQVELGVLKEVADLDKVFDEAFYRAALAK
ncbi:ABC transporter substrate-binding protein [Arenibaculum pallidiluteum]|uniref:ABC transporter substrate-binding protein n=1 Tax=Arenibaculum pallidiluteum TaxID=2812559 RepID=UPI001A971E7E|nr:ABC transporter substrate-binding protein [Arenibaculum pallidiluteum]